MSKIINPAWREKRRNNAIVKNKRENMSSISSGRDGNIAALAKWRHHGVNDGVAAAARRQQYQRKRSNGEKITWQRNGGEKRDSSLAKNSKISAAWRHQPGVSGGIRHVLA
jgi:hypothetical protein